MAGREQGKALDRLSRFGLPLMVHDGSIGHRPTPSQFAHLVRKAAKEVSGPREREAFQALLVALKYHFPTFYKTHLADDPHIQSLWPSGGGGRVLDLARIARAIVAEVL